MTLSQGSKAFLAVLGVLAVLASAGLFLLNRGGADAGEAGTPVTVEIPEGTGLGGIGDLLAAEGVIRSALAFRVAAELEEGASAIQAGTYQMRIGMGTDEALAVLVRGPERPAVFRVTVPEGLTVAQTLQRLAEAEGSPFTVEQLRAALDGIALPDWVPLDRLPAGAEPYEGLLFPNTYDFRADATPEAVLGRLIDETESVLSTVGQAADLDRYEVLIAASLIEREARLREEQAVISSVIRNRLAIDMRLQIDATVLYALGEHKDRVLKSDLEVDSPWNTYRNTGLPPTPISGAGAAAVEAAANPEQTDFLYYVVVDPETGRHEFTRTLEEHNRARAKAGG